MKSKRAVEIIKTVVKDYENRVGIFSELMNIEENLPDKLGEKQKSYFLFFVANLDHGMKSQILYEGARKLWAEDKKCFDPAALVKKDKDELAEVLGTFLRPRYPNVAAMRWKKNAEILLNKYEGDPRKIFDSDEAERVIKRIKEFRGMGDKTGSLFFRAMVNLFGYDYWDIDEVRQPIDVHDMRLSYMLGVMDKEESKNIHKVRELWHQACKDAGKNWLVFDKALWLVGSEGCSKKRCDECSVGKWCKKTR